MVGDRATTGGPPLFVARRHGGAARHAEDAETVVRRAPPAPNALAMTGTRPGSAGKSLTGP
jgi:hypothetical protein